MKETPLAFPSVLNRVRMWGEASLSHNYSTHPHTKYTTPHTTHYSRTNTHICTDKIHAAALIVADVSQEYSHWMAQKSLHQWLEDNGVPALTGQWWCGVVWSVVWCGGVWCGVVSGCVVWCGGRIVVHGVVVWWKDE